MFPNSRDIRRNDVRTDPEDSANRSTPQAGLAQRRPAIPVPKVRPQCERHRSRPQSSVG